jgi:hypothetical protein
LRSEAQYGEFVAAFNKDPTLSPNAIRERDHCASQSQTISQALAVLAYLVRSVIAARAIFEEIEDDMLRGQHADVPDCYTSGSGICAAWHRHFGDDRSTVTGDRGPNVRCVTRLTVTRQNVDEPDFCAHHNATCVPNISDTL